MTEDKIKNLLQDVDRIAGRPGPVSADISVIRSRARQRRIVSLAIPATVAAVILIVLGIWSFTNRTVETREQKKIALLQVQIKQLQARADAAMSSIQEVLEEERRQRQLDELEAQLASIPDPLEEVRKQVDKTAFILVYQADRMYRELNLKNSAVRTYKRVIELFPQTQWAEVARQRLSKIQNSRYKKDSKGDLLWKPQNVPLFS